MGSAQRRARQRKKDRRGGSGASETPRGDSGSEESVVIDNAAVDVNLAWSKLRQGARNVAGVSWQIEVTTYLLVMGRVGLLNFRHFTPEGIEDVDCRDADGLVTYVQMKELGAGHGRMTASLVAEAVVHGHQYAEGRPVAVVTDGDLGSALNFTGWSVDVHSGASAGVKDVRRHLVSAGIAEDKAEILLSRTFLIRLPWDLRPHTEKLLIDSLGIPPAVAGLTVSRLYDLVAAASANQRSTTAQTARTITAGDLDAILVEIQSTLGTEGLDEAVSAGICAPASYSARLDLSKAQFFLGAEGAPGLIAAGLDVVRPAEMQEILDGFTTHRYSLIVAPSGAGKSVLLWRAARDVLLGASVLRVLKISTLQEVELLVRHVVLQRPSKAAPVVVAVDNLGRPAVSAWPEAIHRLREIPWVFLIGAARSEDFSPRLVSGGATLIELRLDAVTARDVANGVQESGIELRMDPEEARDKAEGLLMEYLALLTAGQRYKDVIAEQVEGLRDPNRRVERTLARWVTAAHSLGLGLDADALPRLLEERDDIVGDALGRLRGEHVILKSATEWRGLHELRSATICKLLHESPPPTLTQTFSQLSEAVSLSLIGWFLRRVAQEEPGAAIPAAHSISGRLGSVQDSGLVASALEGAERADSLIYARQSLPILRKYANSNRSIYDVSMLAYPIGNQGISADPVGVSALDVLMQRMSQVAYEMGPRSAAIAEAVGKSLTGRDLVRLTSGEHPERTARLLEACLHYVRLTIADATEIYAGLGSPRDANEADIHARIIDSLVVLAELYGDQISSNFGDVGTRANRLTQAEPWALSVAVKESADGPAVTATVLCPDSAGEQPASLVWDSPKTTSEDVVHNQAMRLAQRLADGCPEAALVEIRTLSPSGSPYVVGDHEPGHKRLKRDVFKRRESVRRAVSFQAALRRLDASSSWTDLVREQVRISGELTRLIEEAHKRLATTDNAARRSSWTSSVADIARSIKALRSRPVAVAVDPGLSHAQTDQDERNHDPVTQALGLIAEVLESLPEQKFPTGIAMSLQRALTAAEKAQSEGLLTLASTGSPLPDSLTHSLRRLMRLQRALAALPATARLIRASTESVEQVIDQAIAETILRESILLEQVLPGFSRYRLLRVPSPDPAANTVDGCDLLLMADFTSIDDLLGDLRSAKPSLRDGLTARVFALATLDDNVLPLAFQLATHTAVDLIPVPPEKRIPLFKAAGLSPEPTTAIEEVAAQLQELVSRSYVAALRRLRNGSWPAVHPQQHGDPDVPKDHRLSDYLVELFEQVVAEEEGLRPSGQLAGALNHLVSGEALDADQTHLLNLVSRASLLSLQVNWPEPGQPGSPFGQQSFEGDPAS